MALFPNKLREVDLVPFDHGLDLLDATNTEWNDLTVFVKHRSKRVYQFRPLTNHTFACSEQGSPCLLLRSLRLHKPHLWLARSNNNCFRICSIVLLAFDEGSYIFWCNQFYIMARFG